MLRFSTLVHISTLVGLGIFSPASYAALLGEYNFDDNTLTASSVASNVSFGAFGTGTGVTIPSTNANGFAAGNPNPSIIRTSWSSSFDSTDYFDFTVTPSGSPLNLSSLVFDAQRSGTGPNQLEIRSSLDNYTSAIANLTLATSGSFAGSSANLSSLTNITDPLNLRIYGYGATGSTGTLRLDNVQLNGNGGVIEPPPFVSIFDIQGTGSASPLVGQTVKTQGVVVGSFLGPDQLSGFFIQDNSDANDPTSSGASNGIFVSAPSLTSLDIGTLVEAVGSVSEFFGRTQINLSDPLNIFSTGISVDPTSVTLPFASSDYLERYEGMSVVFPQSLAVTNNFTLGRFGEVGLSSGGRLYQPTQVAEPGAAANAVQAANSLNLITLDDGSYIQNPDPIPYPEPVPPGLTASNTLRTGETTTGVTGVLDFGFSSYRIQPTATVTFDSDYLLIGVGSYGYRIQPTATPAFDQGANPRPPEPEAVEGNITVGDFNLENYFTTLGSRGAQTEFEFQRQQDKLVSALLGLNADILGIEEVENNGYGPDSAIASLVDALNAVAGVGTYAYIDPGTPLLGTDAIAVGLLYKPAKVRPVGNAAILDTGIFNPELNRPALAQTFIGLPNTQEFTIAVNHFKSKGGTPTASGSCSADDNTDQGDGQGGFNCTRTLQSQELIQWLATNPTGSKTDYQLILGDLNSYAMEDPITTLESAGYVNLDQFFNGEDVYSYQFGGQFGTLDYAFGSPSLLPFVTGSAPWHINSDEPGVLGYSTRFKSPNQIEILYAPDAYASSDHDPILVGLSLRSQSVPEPSGLLGLGTLSLLGFFYRKYQR